MVNKGISIWKKIYYSMIDLPLPFLVKANIIPSNNSQSLCRELGIDLNKPIAYLLPFHSISDLMTLRRSCKKIGLPDPLDNLFIEDQLLPRYVFINYNNKFFAKKQFPPVTSLATFTTLFECHKKNKELDIQMIPCSILWGRAPGREQSNANKEQPSRFLSSYNSLQKIVTIFLKGRDCMIRLSPCVSLRYMTDHLGANDSKNDSENDSENNATLTDLDLNNNNKKIALKLARVANIHFSRQKRAISGPQLPNRGLMFQQLLQSDPVKKIITEESERRQVPRNKVEREALKIMDEIAANFSESLIRYMAKIMHWLWTKLYQGIHSNYVDRVRQLAQDGHEIIYLPCHRSHMDYLLLSYELYRQGLVPPHIAAGINLNFFPAGTIFRHSGAFFIRRSFKGNRLYATIFREYLTYLFTKGYSIEFFCEGGRSRTGRLLQPKTGLFSMTLQAMLRGLNRPVTIVPVYFGYEHVMEVASYTKELRGVQKEKENAGLVFKTIRKLRNYGHGFINFGEPIQLNQYLNKIAPQWRDVANAANLEKNKNNQLNGSNHSPKTKETTLSHNDLIKPEWFNSVVEQLAHKVMTHINDAAATNALTLCALALLASPQRILSREELEQQIQCYLDLLKYAPYSTSVSTPKLTATALVDHAISLNKFIVEQDNLGEIIGLDRQQSLLMTYYRNNIIHLFILPSLIANIIIRHPLNNTLTQITDAVQLIYPFLKAELFLHFESEQLPDQVKQIINELKRQQLIEIKTKHFSDSIVILNKKNFRPLQLLAHTIAETLQRYTISLTLLHSYSLHHHQQQEQHINDRHHTQSTKNQVDQKNSTSENMSDNIIELDQLQKQSLLIAQRLSRLHGINAPEFFDKEVFSLLIKTLKQEGYIFDKQRVSDSNNEQTEKEAHSARTDLNKITTLTTLLAPLISSEISLAISAVRDR